MALQIDNLTLLLLAVLVVLALYHRFYAPVPLVHPLLLGRQADVGQVRQPGESAIYRSWATGQGAPLQVRPAGQLKTAGDAVKVPPSTPLPGKPHIGITQRWILDTPLTNEALAEIVRLVPLGIGKLFPEANGPIAVTLPPCPATSLPLLLLSLAARAGAPLIVLPHPRFLASALNPTSHPAPGLLVLHASLLEELAPEALGGTAVLIVGDPERTHKAFIERAAKVGVTARWWEEIWDAGEAAPDAEDPTQFSDVHSYFYSQDGTVVKVTHMNVTAGVAGVLAAFPPDKRPTGGDTIGSSIRLDTPFGMTLALTAVYSGAGFRLIGPPVITWDIPPVPASELSLLSTALDQPMPSILFLAPAYHSAIIKRLHDNFLASPLASVAARHRLQSLQAGHVARGGLMDSLVWGGIRGTALGGIVGDTLRALIVVGCVSPADVALSHALLGLPLTRLTASRVCAGPVLVSHFYDLQGPPPSMFKREFDTGTAHSGPPASNVEVLLRGPGTEPKDDPVAPFEGRLWVRGPPVLDVVGTTAVQGWTETEDDAAVYPNGCFVVRPRV